MNKTYQNVIVIFKWNANFRSTVQVYTLNLSQALQTWFNPGADRFKKSSTFTDVRSSSDCQIHRKLLSKLSKKSCRVPSRAGVVILAAFYCMHRNVIRKNEYFLPRRWEETLQQSYVTVQFRENQLNTENVSPKCHMARYCRLHINYSTVQI